MNVTILILSVDEANRLRSSLPRAAAAGADRVVVIDNACTDATAALAAEHGAAVVTLPERLTYAAAMNRGLAACSGTDAVLLLNADCDLEPGFLDAAVPVLAADPGLGSVAPKLVRMRDGRIDGAGMTVFRTRRNMLVGHGAPADAYATAAPCFGADGACALYRRETLDACTLEGDEVLDEDMALWATDADLAWRAQLLGWRSRYEPAARARHERTYSPSTRLQVDARHRRLQFRNRLLMWAKNETGLRAAPGLVPYEAARLGYVLTRERDLLGGYADAWQARAGALRRRRLVQARVVCDPPFGLQAPA